jgi:hypothetical protein
MSGAQHVYFFLKRLTCIGVGHQHDTNECGYIQFFQIIVDFYMCRTWFVCGGAS